MQGHLQLWQGMFSRWSRYYFRVKQDMLLFGPNPQTTQFKVHLKVAQIITTVDDPICLILHTGTQTLHIRAHSIQERVKWYKKLKAVQKQSQNASYNRQMDQLNEQLGKQSKLRVLEQYTVELWKAHADLENQLEDLTRSNKIPSPLRKILDKLRITVQQIKFKNSQALQIIEQYVSEIKSNKGHNPESVMFNNRKQSMGDEQVNETKFMSFRDNDYYQPAQPTKHKIKTMEEEFLKRSSSNNYSNNLNQNTHLPTYNNLNTHVSAYNNNNNNNMTAFHSFDGIPQQTQLPRLNARKSSYNNGFQVLQNNAIKQRLLRENEVYRMISSNITSQTQRSILPEKFTPEQKFPILSILSGAIGSDITKMTLPVIVNEPLSALQRGCEQMYYSQLLETADNQSEPVQRMLYVTAFMISQYSLSEGRVKKPFNPLLGQTFQYIDDKRQFEFLSQQVCHHPPISAMYCRSNHFEYFDNTHSKTSFTGSSIKITPESTSKLILEKEKDTYNWNKCVVYLNGLLIGKTFVEVVGNVKVTCDKNTFEANIHFREGSFWKKGDLFSVQGTISERGSPIYEISGRWTQRIVAKNVKTEQTTVLWRKRHVINEEYYNFNDMSFQLNLLNKWNLQSIAPTDSRLRPDQRALEYRMMELAAKQKHRLQENQRARRRQMERLNRKHQSLWLVKHPDTHQQIYLNNGRYWNAKRKGEWQDCIDLY